MRCQKAVNLLKLLIYFSLKKKQLSLCFVNKNNNNYNKTFVFIVNKFMTLELFI